MEKSIREQLQEEKNRWEKEKQTSSMVVGHDEIAKIVSDWTGVPVSKMTTEESERLLKLEELLHERW